MTRIRRTDLSIGPTSTARGRSSVASTTWLTDDDGARWLTWTTLGGLVVAAVLAGIGGSPIDLPMPTYRFGIVTPTCGLTRGSTAIARGDFDLAWRYNPASFAVMAAGLFGVARAAIGLAFGRWLAVEPPRSRSVWLGLAVLIAALWLYQQTNAEFVINSRL